LALGGVLLIADARPAEEILGWRRKYSAQENIVSSAWSWHSNMRKGISRSTLVEVEAVTGAEA